MRSQSVPCFNRNATQAVPLYNIVLVFSGIARVFLLFLVVSGLFWVFFFTGGADFAHIGNVCSLSIFCKMKTALTRKFMPSMAAEQQF